MVPRPPSRDTTHDIEQLLLAYKFKNALPAKQLLYKTSGITLLDVFMSIMKRERTYDSTKAQRYFLVAISLVLGVLLTRQLGTGICPFHLSHLRSLHD